MSEFTLNSRCLGWHCDYRDKCEHHALPARNLTQYFQPRFTGEFCDSFKQKEKGWGDGPEPKT